MNQPQDRIEIKTGKPDSYLGEIPRRSSVWCVIQSRDKMIISRAASAELYPYIGSCLAISCKDVRDVLQRWYEEEKIIKPLVQGKKDKN